jgi:hypothetical protein
MAKSIQGTRNPSDIRRVSDDEAAKLVASGQFKYLGKMEAKRLLQHAAQPNA